MLRLKVQPFAITHGAAHSLRDFSEGCRHPRLHNLDRNPGDSIGRIGPRARSRCHCDVPVFTDVALWAAFEKLP